MDKRNIFRPIDFGLVIFVSFSLLISALLISRAIKPSKSVVQVHESTETAGSAPMLESPFGNPTDYELKTDPLIDKRSLGVAGIVVPHHFLAKNLISRIMENINFNGIDTVILVGPDHFSALRNSNYVAATTTHDWKTSFGNIRAQKINSPDVSIENNLFRNEHSIYTLIPFIAKQKNTLKVTPIVLRTSTDYMKFEELGKSVSQNFDPGKSLIVISSDFSHELSSYDAHIADLSTIAAIRNFDYENISTDCRECFAFAKGFLSREIQFAPFENSNSYLISGENEQSVTSYVTGVFNKNEDETTTVAVAGDVMLDRYIRQKAQINGYDFIFEKIKHYLERANFAVVNLEGPVTTNYSISVNSKIGSRENYVFTFPPESLQSVKNAGIDLVSLGNNHILNQGYEGLESTKQFLDEMGISYFGSPDTENNYFVKEIDALKISFINYNEFDGVENNSDLVIEKIRTLSNSTDLTIVIPHWGVEYETYAGPEYQKLARSFVDNGADAVIGAHPHVIQQSEYYKGRPIFYSLGNLVMDQYFEENVQNGLIALITIRKSDRLIDIKTVKTRLDLSGQTQVVE